MIDIKIDNFEEDEELIFNTIKGFLIEHFQRFKIDFKGINEYSFEATKPEIKEEVKHVGETNTEQTRING